MSNFMAIHLTIVKIFHSAATRRKVKGLPESLESHSLVTLNIFAKFHGNPFSSLDQSGGPPDRLCHPWSQAARAAKTVSTSTSYLLIH